jgi:hypothetical protein
LQEKYRSEARMIFLANPARGLTLTAEKEHGNSFAGENKKRNCFFSCFPPLSLTPSKEGGTIIFFARCFQPGWKPSIFFSDASNPVGNANFFFLMLPTRLEMLNYFFGYFQPGWKRQIIFSNTSNPVGSPNFFA